MVSVDEELEVEIPNDRRYTPDHEWAKLEDGRIRVGITHYAQDALGDIVFVQAPEIGAVVEANGPLGEVESTKSVSDIYAPVAGTVVESNPALVETPGAVNEDPYGTGWICLIDPADPAELDGLLEASGYQALIGD